MKSKKEFLERILKVWELEPDLRFGELLAAAIDTDIIVYLSDEMILTGLEHAYKVKRDYNPQFTREQLEKLKYKRKK